MANPQTVKEYLVELGFKINTPQLRKFEDALKMSADKAEMLIGGMAKTFLIAGGAIATAITAVGAGTLALLTHTADADLEYQKFARRMFIGVDAARSMKIALDALGITTEELIWGPPELAERYRQLVKDQRDMIAILGGDTGERALRKVRDIEFEFTRMGPEIQRLGIRLTEDVMNKLFGNNESLENRLKDFNEWFKQNIPAISDKISNVLVPVLRTAGSILEGMFHYTVGFVETLDAFLKKYTNFSILPEQFNNAWSRQHPGGLDVGGGFQSDPLAPTAGQGGSSAMRDFARRHPRIDAWMRNMDYEQMTRDKATSMGIDPDLALSILHKENPDLNPYAVGTKGELGLFQLMPQTIQALRAQGLLQDPYDPAQNIAGGLSWLLQKPGPTLQDKVRQYNGSGPAAQAYEQSVWNDYMRRKEASAYAPGTSDPSLMHRESYSPGNVTVNIQGSTNMSEAELKRTFKAGYEEARKEETMRAYAQRQGVYA